MEGIFAALSQFDNDIRGGRTKAGMQEALRRGQWIFRPPLGYLADGKTLRLDPERARWSASASSASPPGLYTKVQVLQELTQRGLRTRRGTEVYAQKWGELLMNRAYISRIVQASEPGTSRPPATGLPWSMKRPSGSARASSPKTARSYRESATTRTSR